VVKLGARREEDRVVITIEDNAGNYCNEVECEGLGMNLVDKRIKNLCGNRFGLSVTCTPQEWTRIAIAIPAEGCQPS
jgi:two-component system LytT family sensor kinase